MKKWKLIYEAFKSSKNLDKLDLEFIKITESILNSNGPFKEQIVYSKIWLESWIKTYQFKGFILNLKATNKNIIEIY